MCCSTVEGVAVEEPSSSLELELVCLLFSAGYWGCVVGVANG